MTEIHRGRTVLVTGASKGIGRATALRLDRAGWRVFAGFRKEADAEALRREGSGMLVPVRLDVTDETSIAEAAELVTGRVGGSALGGLVNNAGVAVAAPIEFVPLDAFREQVEVNLTAQLAVTQAFLPLLRRAMPPGRIVNVSSIGGRVAGPMLGAYHASKFGLEGMSDALRIELAPWGIEVILIEPGAVATPIWQTSVVAADGLMRRMPPQTSELYGERIAKARQSAAEAAKSGTPPDAVAKVAERALTARRPRTRYLVGADAKIAAIAAHLLPDRLLDRLLGGSPRPGGDARPANAARTAVG